MNGSLHLASEAATMKAGRALAQALSGGELITLSGDLGAGKTTLSRGLIQALGHTGAVKSPTFTLVETYNIAGMALAHFDLYRLADPEELEYLGIRDYLDGQQICLVEWPQRGAPLLPQPDLALTLRHNGRSRHLDWSSQTAAGDTLARVLDALA